MSAIIQMLLHNTVIPTNEFPNVFNDEEEVYQDSALTRLEMNLVATTSCEAS
jgi:hypothetical protein